jgi:hypothetical protein
MGDFNGDGHLDLAVANQGSNNVSLLLGNGDGTFQAAQNFPAGDGHLPWRWGISTATASPISPSPTRAPPKTTIGTAA